MGPFQKQKLDRMEGMEEEGEGTIKFPLSPRTQEEEEEGTVLGGLRPGGLRPGGLRPGGLRPGGLRPWGIEPT